MRIYARDPIPSTLVAGSTQDSTISKTTCIKREDKLLVSGQATFTADITLTNPLFVSFVRSTLAWGQLNRIEIDNAVTHADVLAVHTGADTRDIGELSVNAVIPLTLRPAYPILADEQIHTVGQPLAAVVASNLAAAQMAAETVQIDVSDGDAPSATIAHQHWQTGDCETAFANATYTVQCEISHSRLAPSPMEPRTISIEYHPKSHSVTLWHSTQTPHRTRSELAAMLDIDPQRLRVIAQHVGGAFGMKGSLYPEEVFCVFGRRFGIAAVSDGRPLGPRNSCRRLRGAVSAATAHWPLTLPGDFWP